MITLAAVLAVEAADRGAVGALAPSLQRIFRIDHAQLGVLSAAVTIVAAAATIPAGMAIDRVNRIAFLRFMVLTWGLAMAAAGAATSFGMLFGSRLLLGGVTAVAYPAVASLTGDVFPRGKRGEVLGRIRTGEMVGAGAGLAIAGAVVAVTSWRAVFWLLGACALVLFSLLGRLREPPRRGNDDDPTSSAAAESSADDPVGSRHRRDGPDDPAGHDDT